MKQESKKPETDQQVAMRVSGVSIFVNVVLSLFKLLAGIIAGSGAMISDAIHSASDVASTVVVIIGVNMAGKKSDKELSLIHIWHSILDRKTTKVSGRLSAINSGWQ